MLYKNTPKRWTTPTGTAQGLYLDILRQPHALLAGATGSGKSVAIHGIISTILLFAPSQKTFVLIDPKRVELSTYKKTPHACRYASEPDQIRQALQQVLQEMETRYKTMQRQGVTNWQHRQIYVIIDELADLLTTDKKFITPILCRLAQLGRASGIHLILATQRPTKDIINGQITVNLDCRLALRCPTAQDSRNIIHTAGAENLPRFGFGYYLTPETMQPTLQQIPMISEQERQRLLQHWKQQKRRIF